MGPNGQEKTEKTREKTLAKKSWSEFKTLAESRSFPESQIQGFRPRSNYHRIGETGNGKTNGKWEMIQNNKSICNPQLVWKNHKWNQCEMGNLPVDFLARMNG